MSYQKQAFGSGTIVCPGIRILSCENCSYFGSKPTLFIADRTKNPEPLKTLLGPFLQLILICFTKLTKSLQLITSLARTTGQSVPRFLLGGRFSRETCRLRPSGLFELSERDDHQVFPSEFCLHPRLVKVIYLTSCVLKMVLQKSTPPQICQLILHYY